MSNLDFDGGETGDSRPPTGSYLRAAAQVAGLALMGVGCYFAVVVALVGIAIARDPAGWEGPLEKMAKAAKVDQAEIQPPRGEKIPIGRVTAAAIILLWYTIIAWIALGLIRAGGAIVMGGLAERKEFLAWLNRFLVKQQRRGEAPGRQGAGGANPPSA